MEWTPLYVISLNPEEEKGRLHWYIVKGDRQSLNEPFEFGDLALSDFVLGCSMASSRD
jgi:hypothetical protein